MCSTKRDLDEEYGESQREGRKRERVCLRERLFTSSFRRDTSLTRRAVYCRKELSLFFTIRKKVLSIFSNTKAKQPFLPFGVPGLKLES